MKILASISHRKYIVEIDKDEIEKVFDKFYDKYKFGEIKVGDEIDLAKGYNYRGEIKSACVSMQDAMKSFERAQKTLFQFASMVAQLGNEED